MVVLRHLLNCSSKVVCCIRSGRKDVRPLCPGAVLCTRDRGCQSSIWRLLETESWAPPPETLIQGSGLGLSICISDTCATLWILLVGTTCQGTLPWRFRALKGTTEFSWAPKSRGTVIAATKLKDAYSLEEKLVHPTQHIKKQRRYFADKGPSSQSYGFSSGHVWM